MSRTKCSEAERTKKTSLSVKSVVIEQPTRMRVVVEVLGKSDLIQNAFSQKALEQMLRKHMGLNQERENKKPRELIEAATVRNVEDRVCIPPTAFKKAMISAATNSKVLKKNQLRIALFVEGNSIPITYDSMEPRMDMVRTSGVGRKPDIRFRPMFKNWRARLSIQFSDVLNHQSVIDLLNRSGNVGIGEWRPEKDGTFGQFEVSRLIEDPKEWVQVRSECAVPLKSLTIPEWALDADIDPELLARIVANEVEEESA